MHQSKKGKQWHFGMKAHIGVDAHSGLVHTVIGTAGNVSDVTQAQALLHGAEEAAFGDAGYQGIENREESQAATVVWHVAMKPSKRKLLDGTELGRLVERLEYAKAPDSSQSRTPFPCREKYLQAPQGPLQRPGQKHGSAFFAICPEQSGAGPPIVIGY
jgi:IS5 family transposase